MFCSRLHYLKDTCTLLTYAILHCETITGNEKRTAARALAYNSKLLGFKNIEENTHLKQLGNYR